MKILMEYKNKLIELNTNKLKKIGQGHEGNVYAYKDIAIKIYRKKPRKVVLGQEDIVILKNIDTKRILLPINSIYVKRYLFSELSFNGYSTKLIENIKDMHSLIKLDSNHLYDEIKIFEDDLKVLSNNRIKINDLWNIKNLIFNGDLYFVDPGSYYINKDLPIQNIFDGNMEELSMALYHHLFCLDGNLEYICDELINIDEIEHSNINWSTILPLIRKIYEDDYHKHFLKSNKRYYLEYLKYILDKYQTISNYKLNVLKEYISNSENDSVSVKYIKKIIK